METNINFCSLEFLYHSDFVYSGICPFIGSPCPFHFLVSFSPSGLPKQVQKQPRKRGRKPIVEEKKQKILELCNAGMSIRAIAKEVKLSKSSISNIVKKNRTPSSIQSKGGRENISEMDITCPNFKYEKNGHIPEIVRKDENGNTKDGG